MNKKKETKSWTFHGLFYVSREGKEEEAACLPCRFLILLKFTLKLQRREGKKLWRKMVTVSCQTIWYGLIKKGFSSRRRLCWELKNTVFSFCVPLALAVTAEKNFPIPKKWFGQRSRGASEARLWFPCTGTSPPGTIDASDLSPQSPRFEAFSIAALIDQRQSQLMDPLKGHEKILARHKLSKN